MVGTYHRRKISVQHHHPHVGPGRAGRYLTAAWATPAPMVPASVGGSPDDTVFAAGPVVGVDLNDGHLAARPNASTSTSPAPRAP
jgi:hypothetical protein